MRNLGYVNGNWTQSDVYMVLASGGVIKMHRETIMQSYTPLGWHRRLGIHAPDAHRCLMWRSKLHLGFDAKPLSEHVALA
jgi:hypothetical protein